MSFHDTIQPMTFEQFADKYPLYPSTVWSTFHIIRDIIIKQEVKDVTLSDGSSDGLNGYLIHCVSVRTTASRKRVLIPWSADAEVDLLWLDQFLKKQQNNDTEVYICIFTPESVIYELVETELC